MIHPINETFTENTNQEIEIMSTKHPTERKPTRSSTELAVEQLKAAQVKMARALPHILQLGHTITGNDINTAISSIGEIIARFDIPPPATATDGGND